MKVLVYNHMTEPNAFLECDCGTKFWIDPCTEQNLKVMKRPDKDRHQLTEVCPTCGKTNQDSHIQYPKIDVTQKLPLPSEIILCLAWRKPILQLGKNPKPVEPPIVHTNTDPADIGYFKDPVNYITLDNAHFWLKYYGKRKFFQLTKTLLE